MKQALNSCLRARPLDLHCWIPVVACLLFALNTRGADQFGDVSVSANAIYTGNTYHGYAEMRIVLENHSPSRAHEVTVIYPANQVGAYGNCIGRLSRTVSVAADTREVISLLQPPLPAAGGDNSIRVEVDGRHEGEILAPNANNHCRNSWRGSGDQAATVLVSRTLDFDSVARIFQTATGAFTPAKADGPPDASGGSWQANTWMPDTRVSGRTNWLELDYAAPQTVNKVTIRNMQTPPSMGRVILISAAGTNLAEIAMSAVANISPGSSGWDTEFDFPTTSAPVKTVRLDFARTPPHLIAIDAVEISGPSGSQWASDTRASSDNSANAGSFLSRSGTGEDTIQAIRSESPISDWSADWLAYSPFDSVVIDEADLSAMPPGVFEALGNYVHAGGNLILLGKADLPASWHAVQSIKLRGGTEFETGFGKVFAFGSENPATLESAPTQRLRETVRENARYFQSLPDDSGAANSAMPVVENVKIPARGTVIIMLVFVVLIGPVNMLYLSRIKRRTWMLWTIPAISFATTLLVFVYSLLREGITPDVRIAGITFLDQTSHRAATIGGEAFYCPLTPSGGLHFDYITEATPLVNNYGSGSAREVDWTQSQNFRHGWISARVPVHFHLRKAETRRERIQIYNNNGKLEAVNSLGATIKSLWFADANQNVYEANNIVAGEKGGLVLSKQSQAPDKASVSGLLHDISFAGRADSMGDAGKYLLPNTYIAVLDNNPFIENGLGPNANTKHTKCSAVVFGILDTADQTLSTK